MDDDDSSVIQTWPRSIQSNKLARDANFAVQLEDAIDNAKAFVEAADPVSDPEKAKTVVQSLKNVLERMKTKSERRTSSRRATMADTKSIGYFNRPRRRESSIVTTDMGIIREEPHFESMLSLPQTVASLPSVRQQELMEQNSMNGSQQSLAPTIVNNPVNLLHGTMGADNEEDPAFVRAIPHIAIVLFAIGWVFTGAWIFQMIDEKVAEKEYRTAVLFSFQICATIGWGDTSATNPWSRFFCTFYTIFGVPVMFSAFANLGRIVSEFYCVDWLFLSAVVRGRRYVTPEVRRRAGLKEVVALLMAHQFMGILIFNGPIGPSEGMGVVGAVYFSITSMATIGLGDLHPDPKNWIETIVVLLYMSSGIVILSALFISLAYHFQKLYYIILKDYLHQIYEEWRHRKHKVTPNSPLGNGGVTSPKY